MCDAASVLGVMNLQYFARNEYKGAPLNVMVHARFPKTLAVFLKAAALTEGVSESTVVRFAVERWAASEGFSRTGL